MDDAEAWMVVILHVARADELRWHDASASARFAMTLIQRDNSSLAYGTTSLCWSARGTAHHAVDATTRSCHRSGSKDGEDS
jgi:hypothetical protein